MHLSEYALELGIHSLEELAREELSVIVSDPDRDLLTRHLNMEAVYKRQIHTVLPTDTTLLQIEEGQDYVTLVTCTPFGINTHRLLVRGHRIPYTPEQATAAAEMCIRDRRMLPAFCVGRKERYEENNS